jgi:hypothetical protein
MIADKSYCDARNIKYLPVIFPGFAWSQWNTGKPNDFPRNAGEFMWRQARNIKSLGVNSMYFAMFDEYDEGTAIMKAATDWTMIPTDQYFLTTSADGIWCSSDFQLRVAGAAIEMLKGTRAATSTVPVPHSLGPVYYRNSFEKRTTANNYVNGVAQNIGTFNLDPCFYNPEILANSNISSPLCEIQQTNVRSGLYSVKMTGTINSNVLAKYSHKISEVKIAVRNKMKLSFWKKTDSELGRFTFVDILTKSGKNLRDYGYKDQNGISMNPSVGHGTAGADWEQFTCQFGNGTLLGDTITGIVMAFDHSGSGTYAAYFDDLLIEDGQGNTSAASRLQPDEKVFFVYPNPSDGRFNLKMNEKDEYLISVFNSTGNLLVNQKSTDLNGIIDLCHYPSGIYVLRLVANNKTYFQKLVKH